MNAEQLDLPENHFDAVISRFGLMLIPRQQRVLTEIRRVLKPGGRLAAIVWSAPERNPLFALYVVIVDQAMEHSKDKRQNPFLLAEADHFVKVLKETGFREVQVPTISMTFQFPSFEALRDWWGVPFEKALTTLGHPQGKRILDEVRQEVRPFEGPRGITASGELLLGVGMK